ncbi:acid phosphatase type 7-like isoform X2 [Oppia nitens]|nr:acid phosphatase type 7-like isoform X2 [Oppia nitens]
MIVTWVTMDPTPDSQCEFGQLPTRLTSVAKGYANRFVDGGSEQRVLFIHRVVLDNLAAGQMYFYHCGSDTGGWSSVYWFSAMKSGTNWSPKFAVIGDLGNVNGISVPYIQKAISKGQYDAVLHIGDFAYDMDSDNARVGDDYMRQMEPVAAYVPYMTVVGNHEAAYNFSNYENRFTMIDHRSGQLNNHFYSFDVGPIHFIGFSSEYYYYVEYGWNQIKVQYEWLENDLKEATKPENRALRPWIITMAHRPMYCSTDDSDDCTHKESIIRKGLPIVKEYGLEDLFYNYGVDIEIWAHEHIYERMWPVYDRHVYNGSHDQPYTNPKAPVHFISGSAGCQEDIDPFVPNPAPWSAVRIRDYGYTEMTVYNNTHIDFVQISTDKGGAVVDKFTVIKEIHGPEAWL